MVDQLEHLKHLAATEVGVAELYVEDITAIRWAVKRIEALEAVWGVLSEEERQTAMEVADGLWPGTSAIVSAPAETSPAPPRKS